MESGGEQDWWYSNPSAAGVANSNAGAEEEYCPNHIATLGSFWHHQHQRSKLRHGSLAALSHNTYLFQALVHVAWIRTSPHLFVLPQQDSALQEDGKLLEGLA